MDLIKTRVKDNEEKNESSHIMYVYTIRIIEK